VNNRYAPPVAPIEKTGEPASLLHARKPKAVGSLQAIALVVVGAVAVGALRLAWRLIMSDDAGSSSLPPAFSVVWRLLSSAVLFVVVLKIQRRAEAGRIAGLALIGLIAVVPALGMGKLEGVEVITAAYIVGWNGGLLVILGLLAWWAYCFGLSHAARGYFRPSGLQHPPAQPGRNPKLQAGAGSM
jgi:hypothetical protein